MKVQAIDPVALVRWLAVTADLHGIPVKWSDKLIEAAKHDAQNPTGAIQVIVQVAQ